jgi:hypothetical protein
MDIFFADPDEIPLPPDEVRILEIKADPYPDGKRVRLFMALTPFQKKPSGDILVMDSSDTRVVSTSFIEAVTPKFEMTLHLRTSQPGDFTVEATLYYTKEIEEEGQDGRVMIRPEKQVVDRAETRFTISKP